MSRVFVLLRMFSRVHAAKSVSVIRLMYRRPLQQRLNYTPSHNHPLGLCSGAISPRGLQGPAKCSNCSQNTSSTPNSHVHFAFLSSRHQIWTLSVLYTTINFLCIIFRMHLLLRSRGCGILIAIALADSFIRFIYYHRFIIFHNICS